MLPYEIGDIMPEVLLRERLDKLFGAGRDTLRATALPMAASHRYALDYIEQAPVLVLLAANAVTRNHVSVASMDHHVRRKVGEYFAAKCREGPKLRALMDAIWKDCRGHPGPGLYQLRKLDGRALRQSYWQSIIVLANIDGQTLAQIMPSGVVRQIGWLRCMRAWAKQIITRRISLGTLDGIPPMCARRERSLGFHRRRELQIAELAFAARVIAERGMHSEGEGEHMADFMADPDNYSMTWSSARFVRMWGDWDRGRRKVLAADDALVDYAPLPNEPVTHAGYQFVPLRSHGALIDESAEMRHCVHSYWRSVVDRQSFIFSVRKGDERLATLEVRDEVGGAWRTPEQLDAGVSFDDAMAARPMPIWFVQQIKAAYNKPPSKQVRDACASFIATIDMPSIDDGKRERKKYAHRR